MGEDLERISLEDEGGMTDLLGMCSEGCHVLWTAYLGDGTVMTRRLTGSHAQRLGNALILKGKLVDAGMGRQGKH